MEKISLVICGLSGKMSQAILLSASSFPQISVFGGTSRTLNPKDYHHLVIAPTLDEVLSKKDHHKTVIVDLTNADAAVKNAQVAAKYNVPIVIGTTGISTEQKAEIKHTTKKNAVLMASNMSLGGNVMYVLSYLTAQLLPNTDVEIAEIHHKAKKDSPSGTALFLANAVAQSREQDLKHVLKLDRTEHPRINSDEIGVFGLRGGDNKGEHTVYFFGHQERVELTHRAYDRQIFAQGALQAAVFLVKQPPGLYNMLDVLQITKAIESLKHIG